jgi:hypothetical protein
MSLELEEDFIGEESHLVPKLDPGEYCNAKKTKDVDGEDGETRTIFEGYCQSEAGKGTDHLGEGRCKWHGGSVPKGKNGAPAHNQNAAKTHTTSDPHHYHENLPPEEQEWIEDTSASILDRIRRIHGREPDFLDRTLARSVAINFHILSKARDYSKDELVQVIVHEGGSHEEKGALVEEVRRFQNSIIQNLKQLGVLEDPETKKANALDQWRSFVDDGGSAMKTDETVEADPSELEDTSD